MFCENCGAWVKENAQVCDKCGFLIGSAAPASGASHHQEQDDQQGMVVPFAKNPKTAKKWLLTALIAVSLVLIGAVAGLIISLLSPKSTWSVWSDTLPAGVTEENYSIEEQVLYRSQTLETTTSTDASTMSGWELYDTTEATGDFGPWSEWSTNATPSTNTKEVEIKNRYRYRNKETKTAASSKLSGWTLYDTTYSWGGYGTWSSWSTNSATANDSCQVENKTQYRYRSITESQEYTSWGSWSSWGWDAVSENATTDVDTRTAYRYYYFVCESCGNHTPYHGDDPRWWCTQCGGVASGWHQIWSPVAYSQSAPVSYNGYKMYTTSLGDGQKWYFNAENRYHTQPGTAYEGGDVVIDTQYRYRTRSLQTVKNYRQWSSWQDSSVSSSTSRQVETRTVYRYRERQKTATYHFYRWGSWSNWSFDAVSANENRQVETEKCYRYRSRTAIKTYHFRRWSAWTEYTTDKITPSSTVKVETKTQYRYKAK